MKRIIPCLFLALWLSSPLQAQDKKFQFGKDFASSKELKAVQTGEARSKYYFGMFSNKAYMEKKANPGGSMFEREMEIVHLPIWQDRTKENESWSYMSRYYPERPDNPIAQYVHHNTYNGNHTLVRQYMIDPAYSASHPGEWMKPNAFADLTKEQLLPYDCDLNIDFVPERGWVGVSDKDCDLPISLGFDKMFVESQITSDAWNMKLQLKNKEGKLLYADPEYVPFLRLSQKEIQKRIKKYSPSAKK
jgi:hypothetical protein